MTENKIRQPIVTVCGHVDHGKTSLLDKIRGTAVQVGEAGGITQKISFTQVPQNIIKERAGKVLEKFNIPLEIPGFLFIDTPGHAAFTNLRKRGGSLADIAILVIDINSGLQPQTIEVLQILKANKTPFIIALNKIDNISGWQSVPNGLVVENLNKQVTRIKENFDEKFYTIQDALNFHGIKAELYFNIQDFTKNVAIVPCSARSGEGISEILAVLCALSQKFLKQRIAVKKIGKGVILEVKKEKAGTFLESIVYDGSLKESDEIAVASFDDIILTRIRAIQESLPLSKGFKPVKKVEAAAGIRMQVISKSTDREILSGMPFQVIENNLEEIKKEFKKEITENIQTNETGIIVKADSLGSLEALLFLLKQNNIPVIRADIGPITKKDLYQANANPIENKVLLGFNVALQDELLEEEIPKDVKILTNDVVYKLIEDFEAYKNQKQKETERAKLAELTTLTRITILPFIFRNSNPAIFGVKVDAGVLTKNIELINRSNKRMGRIKAVQEEKTSLEKAEKGKEVAISVSGANFERELAIGEVLYCEMSEFQFRKFKEYKDLLTSDEKSILQEIAQIKRKENTTWGI